MFCIGSLLLIIEAYSTSSINISRWVSREIQVGTVWTNAWAALNVVNDWVDPTCTPSTSAVKVSEVKPVRKD